MPPKAKGHVKKVTKSPKSKAGSKKKGGAKPAKKASQKTPTIDFAAFLKKAKMSFNAKWNEPGHNTAKLADFEIIRTLGTGQFGRVMFARVLKAAKRQFVAIKILERQKVISMLQTEHVIYEKKVLMAVNFPFLVSGRYSFKDNASLYFVLDFVPGGEMFSNLQKLGKYPESQAKFYAAQVVMSFEYLHFCGIVYRDLKPENLLIDITGYLKITDFGFAKKIDDKTTMTMCGTPEYLAPEVIKNIGYSYSVDWWALGILIYEMSSGKPPFASEDPMKIFEKIMNARVKYPTSFNTQLKDIIRQFLNPNWNNRLGSNDGGMEAVRNHDWFKDISWEQLFFKKIPAPYVPEIKGIEDTSHFEEYDEPPLLELPEDYTCNEMKDNRPWTYQVSLAEFERLI
jgi:protein kinase A